MKNKTLLYSLLAAAILIPIALVGTFAYLTHQTNQKDNKFNFVGSGKDKGIYGVITETKWDDMVINPEYDGTAEKEELIPNKPPEEDSKLGCNMAKKIVPGMDIPKNPILTNKSKNYNSEEVGPPIYAAMKITLFNRKEKRPLTEEEYNLYFAGGAPLIQLSGLGTNGWVADASNTTASKIYYWATETGAVDGAPNFALLEQGESTRELFSMVKISKDMTSLQANKIITDWDGFDIQITGAICQAEYITDADAKASLKAILDSEAGTS